MKRRSVATNGLFVLAGVAILAIASRLSIPLRPVPVTGQTLAVTVIGALYGWRLGAATVVTWLALAALGAPLLADGASGIARFTGPTGGYLIAFPFAAALVGILVAKSGGQFFPVLGAMVLGNALCLAVGAAWLAGTVDAGAVVAKGVSPFLPAAAVKSIVGAMLVRFVARE